MSVGWVKKERTSTSNLRAYSCKHINGMRMLLEDKNMCTEVGMYSYLINTLGKGVSAFVLEGVDNIVIDFTVFQVRLYLVKYNDGILFRTVSDIIDEVLHDVILTGTRGLIDDEDESTDLYISLMEKYTEERAEIFS